MIFQLYFKFLLKLNNYIQFFNFLLEIKKLNKNRVIYLFILFSEIIPKK